MSTETAIETDPGVNYKLLTLQTLRTSAQDVYGIITKKRTIKDAYEDVLAKIKEKGVELPFGCGACNAPLDETSPKCWACGAVIDDGSAEPKITRGELEERATRLKIEVDGKSDAELIGLIEAAERVKRDRKRDVDLTGIESAKLNEALTERMPDGWRKKQTGQYTSYWDSQGIRRIAVFNRGLNVHFSIEDGDINGYSTVDFYDAEERRRRHAGRTNYAYTGDLYKEAFEICELVFDKYSS